MSEEERIRLGIVVSEFNYDITYLMLERAISHANFLNADIKIVIKIPGSFDMPIAIAEILKREDIDAVVTLGAIIQGETKHDEVIAHQAARKILDLSLDYGKPVSLGIIGPGASRAKAQERIDEYAKRAVEAAIKTATKLKRIKGIGEVKETEYV
jgi:6,7-dimethyl-8-ribityllumazine synthase